MSQKNNTIIHYRYTDANNYKAPGTFIVEGLLSNNQISQILDKFGETSEGFIPSQIGIPDLQGELQSYDSEDHGDDHCYHDITEIELTSEDPDTDMSAEKFLSLIMNTEWIPFEISHPAKNGSIDD